MRNIYNTSETPGIYDLTLLCVYGMGIYGICRVRRNTQHARASGPYVQEAGALVQTPENNSIRVRRSVALLSARIWNYMTECWLFFLYAQNSQHYVTTVAPVVPMLPLLCS